MMHNNIDKISSDDVLYTVNKTLPHGTATATSCTLESDNERAADTITRDEGNLYDAIAGLFVNDSFAEEVAAFVQEARQRERGAAGKKGDKQ